MNKNPGFFQPCLKHQGHAQLCRDVLLLHLVEDGVADALHEAGRRLRRDLPLHNEHPLAFLLLRACVKEVAHAFGELLLRVDLLEGDHMNVFRGNAQVLTEPLPAPLSQEPREGRDLEQVVFQGVGPDHGGEVFLLQAVEDFRDVSLLALVKGGLRQPEETNGYYMLSTDRRYCMLT